MSQLKSGASGSTQLNLHTRLKAAPDDPFRIVNKPVLTLSDAKNDQQFIIITGTNSSGKSFVLDILSQHERVRASQNHSHWLYKKAPIVPSELSPGASKGVFYFTKGDSDGTSIRPSNTRGPKCFEFVRCEPHACMLACPTVRSLFGLEPLDEGPKTKRTKAGDETSRNKKFGKHGRLTLTTDNAELHRFVKLFRNGNDYFTLKVLDQTMTELSAAFEKVFDRKLFLHQDQTDGTGARVSFFGVSKNTVTLSARGIPTGDFNELQCEGSGMKSVAAILLHLILILKSPEKGPKKKCVFLLDEPEVFLHPEQCRRLGTTILDLVENCVTKKIHLFASTHSSDFINKLCRIDGGGDGGANSLSSASISGDGYMNMKVQFLRLQTSCANHQINVPVVRANVCSLRAFVGEIDDVKNAPLTLFSKIIDGLFFERVVVVEAPNDAYVYDLLWQLHKKKKLNNFSPAPLFVPLHGKALFEAVRKFYTTSGVVFTVVLDVDGIVELVKKTHNYSDETQVFVTSWKSKLREWFCQFKIPPIAEDTPKEVIKKSFINYVAPAHQHQIREVKSQLAKSNIPEEDKGVLNKYLCTCNNKVNCLVALDINNESKPMLEAFTSIVEAISSVKTTLEDLKNTTVTEVMGNVDTWLKAAQVDVVHADCICAIKETNAKKAWGKVMSNSSSSDVLQNERRRFHQVLNDYILPLNDYLLAPLHERNLMTKPSLLDYCGYSAQENEQNFRVIAAETWKVAVGEWLNTFSPRSTGSISKPGAIVITAALKEIIVQGFLNINNYIAHGHGDPTITIVECGDLEKVIGGLSGEDVDKADKWRLEKAVKAIGELRDDVSNDRFDQYIKRTCDLVNCIKDNLDEASSCLNIISTEDSIQHRFGHLLTGCQMYEENLIENEKRPKKKSNKK